jgi:hypothetical protein
MSYTVVFPSCNTLVWALFSTHLNRISIHLSAFHLLPDLSSAVLCTRLIPSFSMTKHLALCGRYNTFVTNEFHYFLIGIRLSFIIYVLQCGTHRTRQVLDFEISGLSDRYSYLLWCVRSRDQVLVVARFSASVQTSPGAHPASCTMGTGSLARGTVGVGMALTTHPNLVLRLKKE